MAEARTFSEQIRHAIRECGTPVGQLARDADLDAGILYRFLADEGSNKRAGSITSASLDKLGATMGLRVSVAKPTGRPRKPRA